DFLSAREATQGRIDDRNLHRPSANRLERVIPSCCVCDGEAWRHRAAQPPELQVWDCRQYQHTSTEPPQESQMPQKRPTMPQKCPKRNARSRASWLGACKPPSTRGGHMSRRIRTLVALFLVSFALTA